MRRIICLTLVILSIISCLAACDIANNMMDDMEKNAESTPKIQEMMSLLTENRLSEAKKLLHPNANENADDVLEQIATYINGRNAISMELTNIKTSSSTGTSGKARQEQITYRVTLTDGEIVSLNAVYLSNNEGTGFTFIQLSLGTV